MSLEPRLPGTAHLSSGPHWRVGTTSCVFDADLVANVRLLASHAEDIELVLFETPELNNWPTQSALQELAWLSATNNLSYTVHIPSHMTEVVCDKAWEEWCYRMVERTVNTFAELKPLAYVWHWESELVGLTPSSDMERWLRAVGRLAARVASASWSDPRMLAVETLSYPFEMIEDLVVSHGYSLTFDVGHLWRAGLDWEALWERHRELVKVVHLHGIDATGCDHRSLSHQDPAQVARLAALLNKCPLAEDRTITLEVFSEEDWESSRRIWRGQTG